MMRRILYLSFWPLIEGVFRAIVADHAFWGTSPARLEPEVPQVDPSESTRRPDSIASAGAKACGASLVEYFRSAHREERAQGRVRGRSSFKFVPRNKDEKLIFRDSCCRGKTSISSNSPKTDLVVPIFVRISGHNSREQARTCGPRSVEREQKCYRGLSAEFLLATTDRE